MEEFQHHRGDTLPCGAVDAYELHDVGMPQASVLDTLLHKLALHVLLLISISVREEDGVEGLACTSGMKGKEEKDTSFFWFRYEHRLVPEQYWGRAWCIEPV